MHKHTSLFLSTMPPFFTLKLGFLVNPLGEGPGWVFMIWLTEDSSGSRMKYFRVGCLWRVHLYLVFWKCQFNEIKIFFFFLFLCCKYNLDSCNNHWTLFVYFAQLSWPGSAAHMLTLIVLVLTVSSWTMVLIGMGVSYDVGTRVFVQ